MEQAEYALMHAQEQTHWWFRGRRLVLIDLLRRWAPDPPGRILDFGCGTGGNTGAYASLGSVIGVELDRGALRMARRSGSAHLCQASGTALPLADRSIDVVVASDVLEHIADDDLAMREIGRVLRPGGRLIFTVPAHPWLWSDHDRALWHQRRYTRTSAWELVARSGLRLEWLSYWNAILFPAIAGVRLASRDRKTPTSDARPASGLVNAVLYAIMQTEATVLRHFRLPVGVSLVGVATRR